jgi:WD40 repeat protein
MLTDALFQTRAVLLHRFVLMAAVGAQAVLLGCGLHTAPPPAPWRQLHNQAVLFSPDGSQVVVARGGLVGAGEGEELGEVQFLDAKDLARKSSLRRPGEAVTRLAYSPDGKLFAFGTDRLMKSGVVVLQDIGRERQRTLEHTGGVYSIAFSPDGRYLAAGFIGVGDAECGVAVWEVLSGKRVALLQGNQRAGFCICFSLDGKKLAEGGREKVQLWECGTWRNAGALDTPPHSASAVFFPTREPILVVAWRDGTVTSWDLKANRKVASFSTQEGIRAAAVSPDGKVVATSGDDKTIKLWGLATGEELLAIPAQKYTVHSLAFSPDGKKLVTAAGWGTTVRLWDTSTGKELATAS